MPKLTKKQTGSKNRKNITGRLAGKIGKKILNPWGGPNVPKRYGPKGRPAGSSTRMPRPDPQLTGMDYPANDPGTWPIEPDFDNHTLPPRPVPNSYITAHNAAVEKAYNRAGYQ